MSLSGMIRWGGPVDVAGGVSFVIGELLKLLPALGAEDLGEVAVTDSWVVQQLLFLLGAVLLLFGLFGLYARQSEAAGALGIIGFLAAFLGTALNVGISFDQAFLLPILADVAPEVVDAGPPFGILLAFISFGVGWLLFGAATLRARVYPRAAAVLLMVGAVLAALPLPFTYIVLGVAVIWLGFSLFTRRGEAMRQPSRVS